MIALSLLVGLAHGLLITKMRLQPFVVTLCGLLLYRGFALWLPLVLGMALARRTLKREA